MPQVRWLVSIAGTDIAHQRGDISEMTEQEAAVWADGVRAERIERQSTPETTARRRQPENTARRTARGAT